MVELKDINLESLPEFWHKGKLNWNKITKVYNNHKLFGEGLTPIYPKLIPEENK